MYTTIELYTKIWRIPPYVVSSYNEILEVEKKYLVPISVIRLKKTTWTGRDDPSPIVPMHFDNYINYCSVLYSFYIEIGACFARCTSIVNLIDTRNWDIIYNIIYNYKIYKIYKACPLPF